ncbi:hypothetical protein [Bacillus sp. 3255]|uniref:hypothetical protein n=1 Tax=Bacillus sp. 3255 TaxID=2817904 RepID=UPI00285D8451|nr:hypothetical protein [Bacillus sp. 3255]MDR6883772.1 hypothetical protein [Bacillus sp. 3255]
MKFYLLEPEVPGGIGENSLLTYESGKIKEVVHLHFVFEGWLGDDLVTTNPCFIVSKRLADAISRSDLTGYVFKTVEVSTSETFKELYPNRTLPEFKWLIPLGEVEIDGVSVVRWSEHDICRRKSKLVVSEKAFVILKQFNINNCDITELTLK